MLTLCAVYPMHARHSINKDVYTILLNYDHEIEHS